LFILSTMFHWTEVVPRKVWEVFRANPCLSRQFLACIILDCFVNFLDDPYYEPLLWFMIQIKKHNTWWHPSTHVITFSIDYSDRKISKNSGEIPAELIHWESLNEWTMTYEGWYIKQDNIKIGNLKKKNGDHKKYLHKIKILVTYKFYFI